MKLRVWLEENINSDHCAMLDQANQPVTGFSELRRYLIECPQELQNAQLYADDACLQKISGYWIWHPNFYAGEVDLELVLDDRGTTVSWRVDVSNDPLKSGKEAWQQFLQDIIAFDSLRIAGSEPAQHQLGGMSRYAGVWLRYARIKQFFPRYEQGLNAVLHHPVYGYQQQTKQYPLGRLKQITPSVVQQLVRYADLLTGSSAESRCSDNDINQLQVRATHSDITWDTPANRQLKYQLQLIDRRVTQVLTTLKNIQKANVKEICDTRTNINDRLERRIDYLIAAKKQLRYTVEQMPFFAADPKQSNGLDFDAIAGHPHYQLTWRMGVRLLREGISGLSRDENHYLIPSWDVYEAWCFVALAEGLKRKLPDIKWKLSQYAGRLTFRAKHNGQSIKLHSQKSFPALLKRPSINDDMPHSISSMRRPDLILEITTSGTTQFICLDSKYTSRGKRILEEMASAHIYHDSLRLQQKRPVLSLLLVPRNQELERLECESWWQQHQTGCFTLNNSESASVLLDRLWKYLIPDNVHSLATLAS